MRAGRLLRLARHLRKPARERLHKHFHFELVNSKSLMERKGIANCGTVGCAMGEAPLLWPRLVWFDEPRPCDLGTDVCDAEGADYIHVASRLFNISIQDALCLFAAFEPRWWADGSELGSEATAKQVAESIEMYVAAVRAKERNRK